MATREKNIWVLALFILAGLVIGGLLGEFAKNVDFLWWLSYSQSFGIETPILLNLGIVNLTFALMLKINVASIIGVILSILIYKKV